MVHLCILTSLLHIGGWEKDCVTVVFNEELPFQSPTTRSGVDSWLLLPDRTRALHGYNTRSFAAQISFIRPLKRETPLPPETIRRRRRRRRSPWTKFQHGIALQLGRSERNRTQFPRPDAQSNATFLTAAWANRRTRESELRLAAPSIRPMLQATAAYQHDGRLRTAAVRPKSSNSTYSARGNISSDSGWRVLPDIAEARDSQKISRQHASAASRPGASPPAVHRREISASSAPHTARKKDFTVENYFSKQNITGLPRRKKKRKENERHIPAVTLTFENETSRPISPAEAGRQRHVRAIFAAIPHRTSHSTNGTYEASARSKAIPACGLRTLTGVGQHLPECKRNQFHGSHSRAEIRAGRPTRMSNHARMRLISICELQRLDLRQISAGAQTYADTLAIKRSKAGSRGGAAAAGSMRTAGGSTAAALEGHGAETLAAQALAAKDYAGAAEVYNPRTELSAEWFTHAERRYPLEGRGPSRMTMKDYAGAAAVPDTTLSELQRTGAASHSTTTTTAEALLAQAQHELREQLHGSLHAGEP